MLQTICDAAAKLSRNPLGVLSLAFVLVYGIAGHVAASGVLQAVERLILVWFIVLFPVAILIAFYRLVAYHYSKLYSPGDFSEESNFLVYAGVDRGDLEREEDARSQDRSAMEYKILNTMWTKQVNHAPDLSSMWTFRLNQGAPEFLEFREAANRLIGEGLVAETDNGQLYLTRDGFNYCKKHHKEFPDDQWWPQNQINPEKLRQVLSPQG